MLLRKRYARPKAMEGLTRVEKVAESLYYRVRKGMGKDEFTLCMKALEAQEDGLLGTAYCSWLLLRHTRIARSATCTSTRCAPSCNSGQTTCSSRADRHLETPVKR